MHLDGSVRIVKVINFYFTYYKNSRVPGYLHGFPCNYCHLKLNTEEAQLEQYPCHLKTYALILKTTGTLQAQFL